VVVVVMMVVVVMVVVWCRGRRKGKIYGKDKGINETNSPTWSWYLSSYTLS
jgi:hypothetical protein